jgi:hypothetical protein
MILKDVNHRPRFQPVALSLDLTQPERLAVPRPAAYTAIFFTRYGIPRPGAGSTRQTILQATPRAHAGAVLQYPPSSLSAQVLDLSSVHACLKKSCPRASGGLEESPLTGASLRPRPGRNRNANDQSSCLAYATLVQIHRSEPRYVVHPAPIFRDDLDACVIHPVVRGPGRVDPRDLLHVLRRVPARPPLGATEGPDQPLFPFIVALLLSFMTHAPRSVAGAA